MALAHENGWTTDAFLEWHLKQEARYELVDGVPVRMQSGTTRDHARITGDLLAALLEALGDGPCEAYATDVAVETFPNQVRYPDLVIDCGAGDGMDLKTTEPRAVVEVLSPSTRAFDLNQKAEEYRSLETLMAIVLIDPSHIDIEVHERTQDGWKRRRITDLNADLTLADPALSVPLATIYRRVSVTPEPKE